MIKPQHNKTETSLEKRYMTGEPKQNRKILFEDMDVNWYWDERDIAKYIRMWKAGISFDQIVEHFGRPADEVGLLHYYLGMKGEIEPRKRGIH